MNNLEQIVRIYRALENKTEHNGVLEGQLRVADEAMREFLLSTENETIENTVGLALLSDSATIGLNSLVDVRLFNPGSLPVFKTFASLLGKGARLLGPIKDFYIVDRDCASTDDPQPPEASRLIALHQILEQLGKAATVVDKTNGTLVFVDNNGLINLPVNVSAADFDKVDLDKSQPFVRFCTDELHREHRLAAVASMVICKTRGLPANNRIHYVLHNLDKILADAKSQYAVFLSAFSYEKVRDEIESLKIEYATKIHKVLSEIQGQLLGIPAATVIVATQMKTATEFGPIFITNLAVLVGAGVFGLFLWLLVKNQTHTLGVIQAEISRQKRKLHTELLDVASQFDSVFSMLDTRVIHQQRALYLVKIVLFIGGALSGVAFWVFSSSVLKAMVLC